MMYSRFGNFTQSITRQSYAAETAVPVKSSVGLFTVLTVGILVLYFWNHK